MKNKKLFAVLLPVIAGTALAGTGFGAWVFTDSLNTANATSSIQITPAVKFDKISVSVNDATKVTTEGEAAYYYKKDATTGEFTTEAEDDVYLNQIYLDQVRQPGMQNLLVTFEASGQDGLIRNAINTPSDSASASYGDNSSVVWTNDMANNITMDYKITWAITGIADYISADIKATVDEDDGGTVTVTGKTYDSSTTTSTTSDATISADSTSKAYENVTSATIEVKGANLSYTSTTSAFSLADSSFDFDYNWNAENKPTKLNAATGDTNTKANWAALKTASATATISYTAEITAIYNEGVQVYPAA